MRLRSVASALGVVLLTTSCSEPTAEFDSAPLVADAKPNVVLIVIDTLRRDHLSLWGGEWDNTPNLSAFAMEAVRFDRAFSQAPWTTPSIGSLLSSRYPSDLGITSNESRLPAEAELLSEVLQRSGYATGAVVSHTFCGSEWGFDQGFDSFDETQAGGHRTISAQEVSDRAIQFVDAQDRPFFLFAHYFDPHIVYQEHADFSFASTERGAYEGPVRSGMSLQDIRTARIRRPSRDLREVERIYASEIAFTDHHIGKLLEHLRARGIMDDTLVIVTADHGEEFLDHGRWGHAKTLYNEVVEVPLLIRYPRGEAAVVDQPVGLVDVFPTVLSAAGLPPPPSIEGRALQTVRAESARPVFFETRRNGIDRRGVIVGDYKWVVDLVKQRQTLFDYQRDPGETEDLSQAKPEIARQLSRLLEEWIATRSPISSGEQEVELSGEERERLEALGYLDGDES